METAMKFMRVEKKYLLSAWQFHALKHQLGEYMAVDQYGRHRIYNLYLDTPDFFLTRKSIEKPAYKEKMRLRSYGLPQKDSMVFIEIKKKYNGVVYKRRVPCAYQAAMAYLSGGSAPCGDCQIMREIDYTKGVYGLNPMIYLAYDRLAFVRLEDARPFRLTVDWHIEYRFRPLDLSVPGQNVSLLPEDTYLMELKADGGMPLWMSHMLSGLNIYPVSFSKVGEAYQHSITRKEDEPCLNPSCLNLPQALVL